MMKLSDAGRKVWERSYHPLYANNLGDGTIFVGEPGVPFGWVVAKDIVAAIQSCPSDEDWVDDEGTPFSSTFQIQKFIAETAVNQAIALCNALAEEGL